MIPFAYFTYDIIKEVSEKWIASSDDDRKCFWRSFNGNSSKTLVNCDKPALVLLRDQYGTL